MQPNDTRTYPGVSSTPDVTGTSQEFKASQVLDLDADYVKDDNSLYCNILHNSLAPQLDHLEASNEESNLQDQQKGFIDEDGKQIPITSLMNMYLRPGVSTQQSKNRNARAADPRTFASTTLYKTGLFSSTSTSNLNLLMPGQLAATAIRSGGVLSMGVIRILQIRVQDTQLKSIHCVELTSKDQPVHLTGQVIALHPSTPLDDTISASGSMMHWEIGCGTVTFEPAKTSKNACRSTSCVLSPGAFCVPIQVDHTCSSPEPESSAGQGQGRKKGVILAKDVSRWHAELCVRYKAVCLPILLSRAPTPTKSEPYCSSYPAIATWNRPTK
jgi:hypothetical protein